MENTRYSISIRAVMTPTGAISALPKIDILSPNKKRRSTAKMRLTGV
jgi:hypothetical protein